MVLADSMHVPGARADTAHRGSASQWLAPVRVDFGGRALRARWANVVRQVKPKVGRRQPTAKRGKRS